MLTEVLDVTELCALNKILRFLWTNYRIKLTSVLQNVTHNDAKTISQGLFKYCQAQPKLQLQLG